MHAIYDYIFTTIILVTMITLTLGRIYGTTDTLISAVSQAELQAKAEEILNKIDERAKKYNEKAREGVDAKIQQIWYANHDMSDPGDTLFFITDSKYSDCLESLLTELSIEIKKEKPNLSLSLYTWPCGYEDVKNQGFNKKVFDYVGDKS